MTHSMQSFDERTSPGRPRQTAKRLLALEVAQRRVQRRVAVLQALTFSYLAVAAVALLLAWLRRC